MGSILYSLHFLVPKKCQNYTHRGCSNQGFVYTNCHVSTALKLFWRLEPPKKGSFRNFSIFFLFCPLALNEILFLSPPFRPRGTAEKKAKKGKRKILDFPSRIFFKSRKAPGKKYKSSKKKEQTCSSSNCTNIFSTFLLTCCEKYQDYCKMRTSEQSVKNETFLSFFLITI